MTDDDAWRRRRAEELHGSDTLASYIADLRMPARDVPPPARPPVPPIRVEPPVPPPVVSASTSLPARSRRLAAIGLAVLLVVAALVAWRSWAPVATPVPAGIEPPVVRVPPVVEPAPAIPDYTAPPPSAVAPPVVAKSQPAAKPRPTAVRRPSPKPPRTKAARVTAPTPDEAEAPSPDLPSAPDPVAAPAPSVAAEPAPPRYVLPVCKGYQLYRPMTPCRAPGRRE